MYIFIDIIYTPYCTTYHISLYDQGSQGQSIKETGGPMGGHCFKAYLVTRSGPQWMSEMDSERQLAAGPVWLRNAHCVQCVQYNVYMVYIA